MIEGRSEMVEDFTGKDAKSRFDSLGFDELLKFLETFAIFVGDDWLLPFHFQSNDRDWRQEVSNFSIQVLDILLSPL